MAADKDCGRISIPARRTCPPWSSPALEEVSLPTTTTHTPVARSRNRPTTLIPSVECLRVAFEHAPIGMAICDLNARIVAANAALGGDSEKGPGGPHRRCP
jgi:uncharacterized OB-fold protein